MTKSDKEIIAIWLRACVSAIIGMILLLMACFMCGCKTTQYVPVETVRTEYKDRIQEVRTVDSVTDTRFVYFNGDTVIDYRDRVKWRDREVHDSIYVNKTDTIRVPYPVEKKLTEWQQAKMDFGGIAFGALIASVVIIAILAWIARKRRK